MNLELEWKLLYYSGLKTFNSLKEFHAMKRLIAMDAHHNLVMAGRKRKRLNSDGEINSLMIVGTNPSEKSGFKNVWEDFFGQYFGKMLAEAGIDRNSIWMTNIFKEATPENRPLNEKEIKKGMKELMLEIEFVDPTAIVLLGNQARDAFEGFSSSIPVIKLEHPSYIRRFASSDIRSSFINNLSKLKPYVKKHNAEETC